MIHLSAKTDCCGCTACQQICPKACISMHRDTEGFLYPSVDEKKCVECHLCEKVCPVINSCSSSAVHACYGASSLKDTIREVSSSGGVFTHLATKIIEQGGVVFGARFNDDWNVVHDYTDTIDGLSAFRGSKYVQSQIGNSYTRVREFLQTGRTVLFSGTPCQVAGLNHFLRIKYDNLYTLDMVCHSISSPGVWEKYLSEIKGNNTITHITFRDKVTYGWRNYGLRVEGLSPDGKKLLLAQGGHNPGKDANPFMRAFVTDLITRPSCSQCPARHYTSGSDLMLADFWHLEKYHPDWDDNKGMSEVLVLSEKGQQLFNSIADTLFCQKIPYSEVEDHAVHAPITRSCPPNRYRAAFFNRTNNEPVETVLRTCMAKSDRFDRVMQIRQFILKTTGLSFLYRQCKKRITK